MIISNINVSYPNNNFELNIKELNIVENKINVIIGENGCGKSVLLKEIVKQKDAIMLLQNPYIFNKTVYKSLELAKTMCNSKNDIEKMLKLINLESQKDLESGSLSGGQKQRLALAMILMSDKEFVLLDEPFNGIDVYSQKLIVDLIKTQTNKTFIVVTHKLNHAKSFGDYFIFMKSGKIMTKGDKQTFFTNKIVNQFVLYE